ncbi:MAG: TonB-dependent receptor [Lewinella sp.]|nr:TonB-dependent receptor [Lewinella sp.]
MRFLNTLIVLLLGLTMLQAQPPFPMARGQQGPTVNGRFTGTVIDTLTGQPVEFATVVLVKARNDKQIDGGLTETDGSFKIIEVNTGTYELRISFLGYEDKVITTIETTPEEPDADLGTIYLYPSGVNLEEVTVTGEASLIENRIDKLVYNAEKDASTSGGDAADVLRNVPLLSVDLDGNVSLRGSSNIQILINGRPSTMFASSIADALKTIPADQIKSVEVITSPSAKYDGEGSAGIINIITKRRNAEGITGSVNTSIGTRQNNGGLNLNWVRGRFGLNGSANSFWSWKREGFFDFYREDQIGDDTNVLEQGGRNNNQILGYNGSFGAFYDFNAYNSLNANMRFNGFNSWRDGTIDGSLGLINDPDPINFSRFNDTRALRSGYDFTADYRRTYPNSEREFTMAFQLSGTGSDQQDEINQDGDTERYTSDLRNNNDGLNLEYTLQADYVHPFGDKVKLETGLKGVIRQIDSDYETLQRASNGDPFTAVPFLTDAFFYDQDVYAGYLSFNVKLGEKTGIVAGARYERTEIGGDYRSGDINPFEQSYDNILPSIIINRQLPKFRNLKLSYSRRIQRPSLFYINPFTQISDPNNISFGNPGLDPELVDQVELSYNAFIKGVALNVATFYRHTSSLIESYVQVDPLTQISNTSYLNIGEDNSLGFNLFASKTFKQVLTVRGGFNFSTYNVQSTVDTIDLSRQAVVMNGNLNMSLKLPKDWQIEAFGFWRAPRQTLQGTNPSFWIYGMGFRKEFNDRFSLGMRAIEPFNRNKSFPSEIEGENFYQKSTFSIPFRSVGLTLRYNFGNLDFNQQRRRGNVIDNNDQKDGGDTNF